MIKVTIELISAVTGETEQIGEIIIANDASGDADIGNYTAELMKSPRYAKSPGVWMSGNVKGFPRLRLGPYDLLYRVLRATVGKRNP